MDLGDFLKSINETKINIMRGSKDPVKYPSFIIRRLLSYHKDCILDANEVNCTPGLDDQLQYEYLLHIIPRKKRFAKMHKVPTVMHLELIKKYYGYSDSRAMEVVALHTDEHFADMEKYLSEGGVINEKRKPSTGDGRDNPDEA